MLQFINSDSVKITLRKNYPGNNNFSVRMRGNNLLCVISVPLHCYLQIIIYHIKSDVN